MGVQSLGGDERARQERSRLGGFKLWLERHNYSEQTIRNYVRRVADFEEWLRGEGVSPLPDVGWAEIRRYALRCVPETYASRQSFRNALTAFYRFAQVDNPPVATIPIPKKPRGVCRAIEAEELERLLEAAKSMGPRQHAICGLLYYQGLRSFEAAKARWDDFDEQGWMRGIGKGRAEWTLPVHAKLVPILETLLASNGQDPWAARSPYLFPGRRSSHISPATVWMSVRIAAERAGLGKVTPHQLRHTAIATVNDGTELRTAQTFARHVDPKVTAIYTRTTAAKLTEGMNTL